MGARAGCEEEQARSQVQTPATGDTNLLTGHEIVRSRKVRKANVIASIAPGIYRP